jgi:tetratricopeptide (TPR) repeat protein
MKYHILKKHIFLFTLLCFGFNILAQQTEIDANILADYNHATRLYNNKAYAAAQKTFYKVADWAKNNSSLKADATYFDAMCAIKLNQVGADKKVLKFVEENPNSNKKNKAYLNVGNYYFANKKASYSLKWYSKVNENVLSEANKKELSFKMGYALLATQNLTLAKKRFLPLINDPKYGNDSRYYYGFIAYKQEDYDIAEATLQEIADKGSYKSEVTYYLLDISFKAGRFERCIEVGLKLLEKAKNKEKSEISKIVGESYFNLKKYEEAIPYLKIYRGKRGKWNNTDYYQLGYAYYKQNDYENAVKYFNRIIDQKNNVSQNAYYHLGECYLNLEKKPEALNAFKSASEMSFNLKVKEDAALNYAKLSYEEGNPYQSVAEVLQDYLKNYPKSKHYSEINELVVTSYLHQQDYKGALTYLSKKKSKVNKELTYEVSLYRGMQLFNQNKLADALPLFVEGKKSSTPEILIRASYWKAETDYLLENFQKGFDEFTAFKKNINSKDLEEFQLIDYNLGYCAFKLKEYEKSIALFQSFLKTSNNDITLNDDATIRLGDGYFATKEYKKAIKHYKKIIDNFGTDGDYAQYQAAMSYGFLDENNQKIDALKALIKNYEITSLKDDALFQLGNTFATIKNNSAAHDAYKIILEKFPKSGYVPRTLLRKGLLYFNDNEDEKALISYKKIASNYPNTPEAKQAVFNARNVYVDTGNIDEYADWIKTLKFVDITDDELDNTMFEAAENKYLDNKSEKAIEGFQKYNKRFPEGAHALKSNYYLAQLLVSNNQEDKAISNYQYVISQNLSEFSEESLNKLSQIYLEKEAWKKAIPLLVRLEQEANYQQNILFAQSNLMKGYYQSEDYEKAVLYAQKLLTKDKIDANVEYDAKIIIARSAFKTDDMQTAEEFYFVLQRNATGEVKAESLYYNAYFQNSNKEYTESNKTIQDLTSNYSAYKYWGAKALVLMAKNYYALKDAYQATYILENVAKNFTDYEDVVSEAKSELEKIKANEAKTNNSVTPQN